MSDKVSSQSGDNERRPDIRQLSSSVLQQLSSCPKGDQYDQDLGQEKQEVANRIDSRDFERIHGQDGESSFRRGGEVLARDGDFDVCIRIEVDEDLFKDPHEHLTDPDTGQAAVVTLLIRVIVSGDQTFDPLEQQTNHFHA